MKRIPRYKILEMIGLLIFIIAFVSRIYFHMNSLVYYGILGALLLLFLYANQLKKKYS
ncbi:putative membrane protein [Pontibacter sp. HSC-36F09]|nr:putative membrane protein [Pontibacter sp. HSC-36F09]